MTYSIKESHGHNGKGPLRLSTIIPLGTDRRELEISTSKDETRRTLVCRASVSQISECGTFRSHVIGFGREGDFSRRIGESQTRATSRAVYSLHQAALTDVEVLLVQVRAHYAQPAAQVPEALAA